MTINAPMQLFMSSILFLVINTDFFFLLSSQKPPSDISYTLQIANKKPKYFNYCGYIHGFVLSISSRILININFLHSFAWTYVIIQDAQ